MSLAFSDGKARSKIRLQHVRTSYNTTACFFQSVSFQLWFFKFQLWIPHQWLEGNLPVSAKCVVCDRTCGSVLRLQDWRCLWCRTVVSWVIGVESLMRMHQALCVCLTRPMQSTFFWDLFVSLSSG